MNDAKDAKGNLLKVGDKVKRIYPGNFSYDVCVTLNSVYKIIEITLCSLIIIDDKGKSSPYDSNKFIKINDCLKNKIRKLKKLINKE